MKHLLTTLIAVMALGHGFCRAQAFSNEQQDLSYSVGVAIAHGIQPEKRAFVEPNAVVLGINDTIQKKTLKYTEQQLEQCLATLGKVSDKNERSKILAPNKDLLSYRMGTNIANSMTLGKKQYDFDLLGRGFVDGFNGAKLAISTQQMTKALKDAYQNAKQGVAVH
jgi:hypothetical protein